MYGQTLLNESAAGHLLTIGASNPGGHALGISAITPLNSTGRTLTLTCASCHDYHGNSNYRNLRYDPNGTGDSINITAGVDVFWLNAPANPPTSAGSVAAYNRSNIGFKSSWANWCGSCHNQVSTNSAAVSPAHFSGHPVEISFLSGGSFSHADVAHWIAGSGEGFAGNSEVAGEGVARLPFLQPTANDFAGTQQIQSSNMLSCISCHKSHGSDFGKSLRWPYVEGGVNSISGCQQCHHK
jgi:cytochrome c553